MTRIGLLSDTHCHLDAKVMLYFKDCDEIWHAGDIGCLDVLDELEKFKLTRAVFGNIDGDIVRRSTQKTLRFKCEDVNVLLTHIGGYPGKYAPEIKSELLNQPPQLFICGHSHILKVQYDNKLELLHINPGAAGKYGFHKVRTIVRFTIDGKTIKDLEVIEIN